MALVAVVALSTLASRLRETVADDRPATDRPTEGGTVTNPARLQARPSPPTRPVPVAGTHPLGEPERGRDGVVHVPAAAVAALAAGRSVPLLVMLHGAGGTGAGAVDLVRPAVDELGFVVVAPDSRRPTWDVITGSWGPDVAVLDRALVDTFGAIEVDRERIVIAGFSDGASYALSIGLANGDLFRHIAAFSPGFAVPPATVGRPTVFISHGVDDTVLPIDRTARVVGPRLRRAGYDLDMIEFPGGHVVPPELVRQGLAAGG